MKVYKAITEKGLLAFFTSDDEGDDNYLVSGMDMIDGVPEEKIRGNLAEIKSNPFHAANYLYSPEEIKENFGIEKSALVETTYEQLTAEVH